VGISKRGFSECLKILNSGTLQQLKEFEEKYGNEFITIENISIRLKNFIITEINFEENSNFGKYDLYIADCSILCNEIIFLSPRQFRSVILENNLLEKVNVIYLDKCKFKNFSLIINRDNLLFPKGENESRGIHITLCDSTIREKLVLINKYSIKKVQVYLYLEGKNILNEQEYKNILGKTADEIL